MSEITEALKEVGVQIAGAIKEAAAAVGSVIGQTTTAIGTAIRDAFLAAVQAGSISAEYIQKTLQFHFDFFAQYTLGKKFFKSRDNAELGWFGQILLTIIPFTVVSWIASGIVAPLFYNSYQTLRAWYVSTTNLALLDLAEKERLTEFSSDVPWYRYIYGIPGVIFGVALGFISAVGITLIRIVTNSVLSLWHVFAQLTNAALEKPDKKGIFGEDTRKSNVQKYILGLPGALMGILAGSIGFAVVGAYRVIGNSMLTAWQLFIDIANIALTKNKMTSPKTGQNNFQKYVLGFPGLFVGTVAGIVGIITIEVSLILSHTALTAWHVFAHMTNAALEKPDKNTNFGKDTRTSDVQKYVLGFPGIMIGVIGGAIGFSVVGAYRIAGNSALTAWEIFINITNAALDKNKMTAPKTDQSNFQKYILGFPGLFIGTAAGVFGFGVVGFARIISNSALTAWHVFAHITNAALEKPDKSANFGKDTRTSDVQKYVLGFPGTVIGVVAGMIGFSSVGAYRIVGNSALTTWHIFVNITNTALDENKIISPDTRKSNVQKYVLGFPGLFIGTAAGAIGFGVAGFARIVTNSALTAWHVFAHMSNAALEKPDKNTYFGQDTRKSDAQKYVLGFPGTVIGFFAGTIGFISVGIYRVIGNSALTAWSIFGEITKRGLKKDVKQTIFNPDKRTSNVQKYVLGAPGVLIGGIAGFVGFGVVSIASISVNSGLTAWYLFAKMTNFALDDKNQLPAKDKRLSNWQKYALGFPGLIIGSLTGIIGLGAVGITRMVSNSALTAWHVFAHMSNAALEKPDKNANFGKDTRTSDAQKYILGFPGSIVGFIAGAIGFSTIGAYRIVGNSTLTAWQVFVNITNTGLEKTKIVSPDTRKSPIQKYVLGFPGLFIGAAAGVVGFTIVGFTRILSHSALTTWHVFAHMTNAALEKPDKNTNFGKDTRTSDVQKYVLGFPGTVIGVIAGTIGFITVGAYRIVGNSALTAWQVFVSMTNTALEKTKIVSPDTRKSNVQKYILGFPGLFVGAAAGVVGVGVVGFVRIIRHSALTAWHIFAHMTNAALEKPNKNANFGKDTRQSTFNKYVLGVPGTVIGVIAGTIGFITVGAYRIIGNSALTAWQVFVSITNTALEKTKIESPDTRKSNVQKYILGFPGLFIGTAAGVVGFGVVGLVRIISHSALTAWHVFAHMTNAALENPDKNAYFGKDNRQSDFNKYVLGFPGTVMGGIAGVIGFAVVGGEQIIRHSAQSWLSLSGSLLNLGLGHPFFKGLSADNRSDRQKRFGSLGYVVAIATTGVVSLGYVIGKSAFYLLAFSFGVLCALIIAPTKYGAINKHPRFSPNKSPDEVIEKFKNIYSALGTWGRLPENSDIIKEKNGGKGLGCFIRKSVTFNISSQTERVVDSLLDAYKNSGHKSAFFNQDNSDAKNAIDKVKRHYKSLDGWLDTEAEISERDAQIDDIAEFVTEYMHTQKKHVPKSLYQRHEISMQHVFWGDKSKKTPVNNAPNRSQTKPGRSD